MPSKRPKKQFDLSSNILELGYREACGGWGGGRMLQNIMHALCAVIRPDHFKFASYGPALYGLKPDIVYIP